MPRGGNRDGAGRPKGAKTRNTEGLALAAESVTPLLVMKEAMLAHYNKGELDQAAAIAKDMAPYVHRKLAPEVPKEERAAALRLVEILVVVDGNGNPIAQDQRPAIGVSGQ